MSNTIVSVVSGIFPFMNINESKAVLAANLRLLMDREGLSEARAGKKIGVSQRTVNKTLSAEGAVTLDTLDKIATGFKVPVWLLITENMDMSEVELVENYRKAPEQAKFIMKSVAEASVPIPSETPAKIG